MITETAFAKLNLALHVRERRADGYHAIETVFAFVDDGDRLTVEPADALSLHVTGRFAEGLAGPDNLVLRSAKALRGTWRIEAGAAITLDKRLPVASGLGGGSADAAAAARALRRLWGVKASDDALAALLASLGADIPACVASSTQWGEGTGAALRPLDGAALAGTAVLLVNPGAPLATGPVFAAWDRVDRGPLAPDLAVAALASARNDLEAPAIGLCPAIADTLAALRATSPRLARMAGSGASCFALYDSKHERDAASAQIAAQHPGCWMLAGALR